MRRLDRSYRLLSAGAVASVVLLGFAAKAPAEPIEWSGTFELLIQDFPPASFWPRARACRLSAPRAGSAILGVWVRCVIQAALTSIPFA